MQLIHIGLPKSASTYIQAAAQQRGDVQVLQWHNYAQNIVHGASLEAYLSGPGQSTIAPHQPQADTPVFVSSEELCGWAPRPVTTVEIQTYQRLVAAALKHELPDAKVLIVTRSPLSFVDSYYNQAVKEGASENPCVFAERWHAMLLQLLNYTRLYDLYASLFGASNVLVIPVELLRDDPNGFYDQIEAHAGFTLRPRSPQSIQHNRSLTGHELQAMRVLNRILKVLSADQRGKPEQFLLPHLNSIKRSFLSYYIENDPNSMRRSRRLLRSAGVSVDKRKVSAVLVEKWRGELIDGLKGLAQAAFPSEYLAAYLAEVGG
ncbi:hypothetical protein J1G35_26885 [Pseudomonas sp. SH10-3B]|uniref:hypothetical protein n=1 Tax=Pseudomonas sp. SH10-3B TaxID=2816049 RepID=UPI001CA6A475|nr:hypothetical protein [Pseudomonas sp. SH10-3B]MBY8949493.1 hypothetical protein [Pseudomonas sp. SH10-3B]